METAPYRWVAGLYDLVLEPLLASAKRAGVALHTPPPGSLVLDIGCGTGAQLRRYQAIGCRVACVDPSPSMAAQAARALGPTAAIHVGDGAHLPHEDGTVDLVLMSMMLHEIAPAARARILAEAARVLKADGRILVLDYHAAPRDTLWGRTAAAGIFVLERIAGGEHFTNYRQFIAAGGVPPLAAGAGLQPVETKVLKGGNLGLYLLRTP